MALKPSLIAVVCALIASITSKSALAETVRFGTFDFVPYVLKDDPAGRAGLFVDINNTIAQRSGIPISNSVLPIARVIKDMEHGFSDCAVFAQTPWTLENFIQVAEIHNRLEIVIVTRPGLSISNIEGLYGYKLAIPRGTFRNLPISTDPKIQRVQTNGYLQSIRLLKAGRVDAIAGSAMSIYYIFSTEDVKRSDIGVAFPFEINELWLQCAKDHLTEETLSALGQTTQSLRMEGVFEDLIERYIPPEFK